MANEMSGYKLADSIAQFERDSITGMNDLLSEGNDFCWSILFEEEHTEKEFFVQEKRKKTNSKVSNR